MDSGEELRTERVEIEERIGSGGTSVVRRAVGRDRCGDGALERAQGRLEPHHRRLRGRRAASGPARVMRLPWHALLLAACGGSSAAPAVDAGTRDAASPADSGTSHDASAGYQPDPVTTGADLPPVVPVVKVDVGGQSIERDVHIPGTIAVYEDHDGTLGDLDTRTPTLSSPIAFEGRGNFTWSLPKKGYAFEFHDGSDNEVDRELLGLPPGSDFALYACYTDKTCLRNALVFAIGQELGRWSPRTRFIELFIDDEYRGLYMIWERVRRDHARVDLPRPAASADLGDISGGYIVRHEGGGKGGERDFTLASGRVYTYHYPDVPKITAEQSSFVRSAWQSMEDALAADVAGYAAVIDEASWVDHAIVEELTNNWDGYVHSIYMTRDPDAAGGRIGMGPLWDFDLAFGNGNVTGYNCRTDNWAYQIVRGYPDDVPDYWLDLYADPGFQRAWKCRWQQLRAGPLELATFENRIATWVDFTSAARARDQARWPTIGTLIFPNCTNQPSYEAEVAWLHDWIAARLEWLDAQATALPGSCP